ncbi:MAG: hypothetical protein Q9174_000947 [Haloplaca sp. 1 TL-2023]
MLTRSRLGQEAFTCLPCQYRLAFRNRQVFSSERCRSRKSQHRKLTTSGPFLQEHVDVEKDHRTYDTVFQDVGSSASDYNQEEIDIQLPDDRGETRHPRDAGYFFKRANLYSSDALGVTSLGKPAEVLRVRDRSRGPNGLQRKGWFLREKDKEYPGSQEPLTSLVSSEILERVKSEQGLISTARANENIDELKQLWLSRLRERAPTDSEYHDLSRSLYDGFTRKQLLGYINRRIPSEPPDLLDLSRPYRSNALTRTAWRAGTTIFPAAAIHHIQTSRAELDIEQGLSPKPVYTESSITYESRNSKDTLKHHLVKKILWKCWNIKPREALDAVGEMHVQLDEASLELVASHSTNILRQLAVEYEAKIDITKSDRILRIGGFQSTCASSLKLLSMVLDDIKIHDLDIMHVGGTDSKGDGTRLPLKDAHLREIERLSNTVLRWREDRDSLRIHYLGNDLQSVENARRFLDRSSRPVRAQNVGVFFGGNQTMRKNLIPTPVEVGKSLPLLDRAQEWTRMQSPSHDEVSNGNTKAHHPARSQPNESIGLIQTQLESSQHPAEPSTESLLHHQAWTMEPVLETSAVLGRILYPKDAINSRGYTTSSLTQRRVLDTDVPRVRRALEYRDVTLKAKEEFLIKMQVVNEAGEEQPPWALLPNLEIRLAIQDHKHAGQQSNFISSVRFVLEEKEADLILPHKPMDIRFRRHVYTKAIKKELDPRIVDFINASSFAGRRLDQMETPQSLVLGLPKRLLNPRFVSVEGDDSDVQVQFSFGSLELHSILYGHPFDIHSRRGISLKFSTIDSGSIGGCRQELRFSETCKMPYLTDSTSRQIQQQEGTKSNLYTLYDSMCELMDELQVNDLERSRYESSRMGRSMLPSQDPDTLVKRRASDVPIGSNEETRLRSGPKLNHARIRRTLAD